VRPIESAYEINSTIMPRILISVIENISDTNGTTVRARNIAKILKNKFDILLITRANSVDNTLIASLGIEKDSIKVVRPQRTKLWNIKLIPIILRYKVHIVYCVTDIFGFFTYYTLSKFLKYKIVLEAHALAHKEKSRLESMIYYLLEVFVGSKANAIVALSGITYRFYKRFNKNTYFIPVFVDVSIFNKCITKNKHMERKVIGLIGPFDITPNKGQLNFLYANLNKFDERIRFKIIGKCDKRIRDERIEYTGYLKSLEEYVANICQLDALLVPAEIATFGPKNKILEAMSCGVPVFSTYKGVIGLDFARPGVNIVVCKLEELTQKVNELIFDEKHMIEISRNARKTVEMFYNKTMLVNRILLLLNRLL